MTPESLAEAVAAAKRLTGDWNYDCHDYGDALRDAEAVARALLALAAEREPMRLDIDPEWLMKMAEKDTGSITSVGGLVQKMNAPPPGTEVEFVGECLCVHGDDQLIVRHPSRMTLLFPMTPGTAIERGQSIRVLIRVVPEEGKDVAP